ncbi:MAG: type I-E CRISPR-associated protein Cse2/CasB [Akkermansiaceae bacterium]|nr:type I-E CRISPR-associated protein Cse2/CasB [Akkermansiaceae bacterium]
MSTDNKPNHADFIKRLQKITDDRGNRAALRKYWSPTTRHQAYPILGLLGALGDERKTITAALFAEHPEHRENISVGKAALLLGDRKDGDHPYDRHFRRLLACDDLTDLGQQLHRLIKRISREGIGLDYADLHKRLNFWANYRDEVKLYWAADFWQASEAINNLQS